METRVNLLTKEDILKKLSEKGFFIDLLTLEAFLRRWKIEAVFEDEQGIEFYDNNSCEILEENLIKPKEEPQSDEQEPPALDEIQQNFKTEKDKIEENLHQIKWHGWNDVSKDLTENEQEPQIQVSVSQSEEEPKDTPDESSTLLANEQFYCENQDAPDKQIQMKMQDEKEDSAPEEVYQKADTEAPIELSQTEPSEEIEDKPEDLSLIADSFQVQQTLEEAQINEIAQRIAAIQQKTDPGFKLDVSDKLLNMIARTIAKKIIKQVNSFCMADAQQQAQLTLIEEKNNEISEKLKKTEAENKKLRLLLAETNKNLNSYKPTWFGLYKFVKKKVKKDK